VKHLFALFAVLFFVVAPAFADEPPYVDTTCGGWVNDVWVPNGKCVPENTEIRHDTVSGTITSVSGHLVTVQQATKSVIINDKPALDAKQTGKVAVGRIIVAYGFWQGANFYATALY
jgi:hypothetical protein